MAHASSMDMDATAYYPRVSTRDARFDRRLFVGVKTTGFYCRPICPARTPKFENVSFNAALHLWAAGIPQPALPEKLHEREAA